MMKKILGGFLLSIPFLFVVATTALVVGWGQALIGFATMMLLCCCVGFGAYLLMD